MLRKSHFLSNFFCFRAQSYKIIPIFASVFSINKLKIDADGPKKDVLMSSLGGDC